MLIRCSNTLVLLSYQRSHRKSFASCTQMQYIKKRVKKDFISAVKGNRFVALSLEAKSQGHFVNLESIELNPDSCCKVFLKGLDFPVLITKQVFTNKNQSAGILYLACSNLDLTATDTNTIYQKKMEMPIAFRTIPYLLSLPALLPSMIRHSN